MTAPRLEPCPFGCDGIVDIRIGSEWVGFMQHQHPRGAGYPCPAAGTHSIATWNRRAGARPSTAFRLNGEGPFTKQDVEYIVEAALSAQQYMRSKGGDPDATARDAAGRPGEENPEHAGSVTRGASTGPARPSLTSPALKEIVAEMRRPWGGTGEPTFVDYRVKRWADAIERAASLTAPQEAALRKAVAMLCHEANGAEAFGAIEVAAVANGHAAVLRALLEGPTP